MGCWLTAGVEWAALHEPTGTGDAAYWWEAGRVVPLAGEGAPEIAEYAIGEFAAALGVSTEAGRRLIGHGLEVAWRLPNLWKQLQAGRVPAWRATRVADATVTLSRAAAGFVDRQVAAVAGRVSLPQLDHLVLEAKIRVEGLEREDPENPSPEVPDTRHVAVHTDQVPFTGTVAVTGELDLADALHLDQALVAGAEQRKVAGSAVVTVTPVIDLNGHVRVDQDELPDRLKEMIDLRDGHCVFPSCTRPARGCDHDHAIPYDPADPARGPTCSCNTAPLCRSHHRLKTHTPWRYQVIEPGVYAWTTPHGYHLVVDHTGTRDATPPDAPTRAACLRPVEDPGDPPDQ